MSTECLYVFPDNSALSKFFIYVFPDNSALCTFILRVFFVFCSSCSHLLYYYYTSCSLYFSYLLSAWYFTLFIFYYQAWFLSAWCCHLIYIVLPSLIPVWLTLSPHLYFITKLDFCRLRFESVIFTSIILFLILCSIPHRVLFVFLVLRVVVWYIPISREWLHLFDCKV